MSVQFRSRIKSVIDYSKVLNGVGVCCDKNGNKTLKAFYDCYNDGGNYIPGQFVDEITCPPADIQRGCCCACAFVDDLSQLPYPWNFINSAPEGTPYYGSGVYCGITKCECERLNGKFIDSQAQSIELNAENIVVNCYKPAPEFGDNLLIDARYPRSCCHIERDPVTGWPTNVVCTNVCTKNTCSDLGTIENPAVYNTKTVCGNSFYIIDSTGPAGQQNCSINNKISQMINKTVEVSEERFGSCYELIRSEETNQLEYSCEIKQKSSCDGYWKEKEILYCKDKYTPQNPIKIGNNYEVQKLTQSQFDNLNLRVGDEFQGGKFIGVYEPGSPVNTQGSPLFGNVNFGDPEIFIPSEVGIGGQHKKWALIVDETQYNVSFLDIDENDLYYETSLWDGYYNTYGNFAFGGIRSKLLNSIRYKNRNGFIDYYLPSIYELYFYWKYLIENNDKPYQNISYITSSIFNTNQISKKVNKTIINNKGMIYCGTMLLPWHLFKTILVEKTKKESAIFFRKIVIEN